MASKILRYLGILAVAGALCAIGYGFASAATSPTISIRSPQQYFSPDGDGQDDLDTISYCLAEPANVTVSVRDSSGQVIRTLQDAVSEPQSDCYYPNSVTWDGRTDTGAVAAPGVYTLGFHAVDATGGTDDESVQAGIYTGNPGALSTPQPNDVLTGTLHWTFAVTPGFTVASVSVGCPGAGLGSSTGGDAGNNFTSSGDTSGCANGASTVTAAVSWKDAFGTDHRWTPPDIPVTVANAPTVTIDSYSHRYFSPDGDGQEDTASIYYCLTQNASVGAVVTDAAGTTVRTIAATDAQAYNCRYGTDLTLGWDGQDDAGHTVSAGVYTVRLRATDSAGRTGEDSVQVGVGSGTPGALTVPAPDASLAGTLNWVFTPASGFSPTYVNVYCNGANLGYSSGPAADQTFTGSGDTTGCTGGANAVTAAVSWSDAFGAGHYWTGAGIPVTVDNAPTVSISPYSHRYFSPDGDGQDDVAGIYYCLSEDSSVGLVITDATGATVRTIAPVEVTAYPCQYGGNLTLTWDGMNDTGAVVPDGEYRVQLTATNAAGRTGQAAVQVAVETKAPGVLNPPKPHDSLTGTLNWVFTPTTGYQVNYVYLYCSGGYLGSSYSPAADGTFVGSGDTSTCPSGTTSVFGSVAWTDAYGSSHYWTDTVPVTIANPPGLRIASSASHRYFSPNGDGQDDVAPIYFCLQHDASVGVKITDATGATVRTIASTDLTGTPGCTYQNGYLSWDGMDDAGKVVPDGVYTVALHAVDPAGGTGDDSVQIGVDNREPGTLTTPKSGSTLAGLARIVFQPTAGYPISQITANFDTGGGATIYNASPDGLWRTSLYTGSLTSGAASLHATVYSTDAFGANHTWTLPDTPVTIDVTSLPLSVTASPLSGPAPLATTLQIDTSDPAAGSVHYAVNFGDGTAPAGGDVTSPYATVSVPHTYARAGVYRAVVTVSNTAGALSTRSVDLTAGGRANTAPTATLTLDSTSGVVPLPVSATLTGTDAEHDALSYTLDFGDGSPVLTGALPQDAIAHSYTKAGTYIARLAVSDGELTTTSSQRVVVGLATPLAAKAGDDQVAMVASTVNFDGSGSQPSVGIESYHWTFGDGGSADGVNASHVYATAGSYTAQLTVSAGGQSKTDDATITVTPPPTKPGLVVTASDGSAALAGASLVVLDSAGRRYSATTDDTGQGYLSGLVDGSYTVYGWKSGYLPGTATATIANGGGTVALTIRSGQVATTDLTSTPLTVAQIVAAGIDPTAPDNQHVYQFTANLALDSTTTVAVAGYAAQDSFATCPQVDGHDVDCGGGGGDDGGGYSFSTADYTVNVSVNTVNNVPQLVWLVIPAKASWLKEFFDVRMLVTNLGDTPFTLDHGAATLNLPAGLSLAPTATTQDPTMDVPDIAGGASQTVSWLVRGDTEGEYDLTASYAGTLEPFGASVTVDAATSTPLHVWGGSALKLTVDADATATAEYPYEVDVELTNVADVPVYNLSLEALTAGAKNFIYQPRERLSQATAAIAPGDTFTAKYLLLPTVSGTLDLSQSFVQKTAGDTTPASTITSHPPAQTPATAPTLTVDTSRADKVSLTWQPVPGATEYAVYATPSADAFFGDSPVTTVLVTGPADTLTTTLDQPAGTHAWYAISPLVDGVPLIRHPLTLATATNGAQAPDAPTAVLALAGDHQADVSWTAPDGASVTGYTVTASPGGAQVSVGGAVTTATISGLTNGTAYTFTVVAKNGAGSSPASDPSPPVTPAGVPGVPTAVTAARGDGAATVSWTAPDGNGSPVTSYLVSAAPGSAAVTVPGSATSAVVAGLTNGTAYTFTVTAVNSIGSGAASPASAEVTPSGAPGAPGAVLATAGPASATVSWTAPTMNGDVISSYTVTSTPGAIAVTVPGSVLSTTLTGLTNGTSYRFTVTATNDAGTGPPSAASNSVQPVAVGPVPTAPTVALGTGPPALTSSKTASLTFVLASPSPTAKLTATCVVDGAAAKTCTTGLALKSLKDGQHVVTVTAHDGTGQLSAPLTVSWQVDTKSPKADLVSGDRYVLTDNLTLAWTGSDAGSGVASYDVHYRVSTPDTDGTGYVQPAGLTGTTATTAMLQLPTGDEYCFSVRGTDAAGNVSDWSKEMCQGRPLDDLDLTATAGPAAGAWARLGDSLAYQQTVTSGSTQGAGLTRTLRFRRLALVATTCHTCGTVAVYDGSTQIASIKLTSSSTQHQVVLPIKTYAGIDTRTISVVVTSSGRPVMIDGLAWRTS